MAITWIMQAGEIGVTRDLHGVQMVPNAWSLARNVIFNNHHIHKAGGMSTYLDTSVSPYGIYGHKTPDQSVFAYMGLQRIWGYTPSQHDDITRASGGYNGAAQDLWQATSFNDWVVFNNGVDIPQAWAPPLDPVGSKLVDLPNWPTNVRARVIKAYKNFLVAADVTEGNLRYPRMVRWSHPAAPGNIPPSWDYADPTKDAGRVVLSEKDERLVWMEKLGDVLVLYTEDTTTAMQFVGGPTRFAFRTIYDNVGILGQKCAANLGRSHFLVTMDDVVMHALSGDPQSIIDQRNREWLFRNINPSAYWITKTVVNSRDREIWIMFPGHGSTLLNLALCWNFRLNTWAVIDLPNATDAIEVLTLTAPEGKWDADSASWDSDTTSWDVYGAPYVGSLMLSIPQDNRILLADSTLQKNQKPFISFVERNGFAFSVGRDGQPAFNVQTRKYIQALWPVFEGPYGTRIKCEVGSHNRLEDQIVWQPAKDFIIGKDDKVDLYAEGRYLAFRYTDYGDSHWHFLGHGLDIEPIGAL